MGGFNDLLNNPAVNFQSESPKPWPTERVSGFRNRNQVFSTEILNMGVYKTAARAGGRGFWLGS